MADPTWTLGLPFQNRFPFKIEHEDTLGNVIPNGIILKGFLDEYERLGLDGRLGVYIRIRFSDVKKDILKYIKDV